MLFTWGEGNVFYDYKNSCIEWFSLLEVFYIEGFLPTKEFIALEDFSPQKKFSLAKYLLLVNDFLY